MPTRRALALALFFAAGCADDQVQGPDTEGTSSGTASGTTDEPADSTGSSGADPGASDSSGSLSSTSTAASDSETTVGVRESTSSSTAAAPSESSESSDSTTGEPFVCAPLDLGSALGQVYSGTTSGSGDDLPATCVKYDSAEVELMWTAPRAGAYQIDTLGSTYDTALVVYDGDCDGAQLACNDDFDVLTSAVLVELTAGQSVVVAVDGFGGATGDFVLNVSSSIPGDCCTPSLFPGCDDDVCEAAVCALDPTCCSAQWTEACATGIAPSVCDECAPPGSCCFSHPDPSCDDAGCANDVCAVDPTCCDTTWSQACADTAVDLCVECQPGFGSCCTPHAEPGCSDLACELQVCALDAFCCDVQWEAFCAQLADDACTVCQDPGPCCIPNGAPSCTDAMVADCVCASLPQCCAGPWGPECVAQVDAGLCGTCVPGDLSCVDLDLGSVTGQAVATGTNLGLGDGGPVSCAPPGGEEVVFTWTAPSSGSWVFDTLGTDYNIALAVRHPDCVGDELACAAAFMVTGQSVIVDVPQGITVLVVIDGYGPTTGNYQLNINTNGGPACPDFDLGSAVPVTVMGSTVDQPSLLDASCAGGEGNEVGWLFTAPADGTYTFDTAGSNYDTQLSILDGPLCMGLELACNDDAIGVQSQVTVVLDEGQQVSVIVDGFGFGTAGDYVLNVTG